MIDSNLNRISYDCGDENGDALFIPVCPICGRFVKSDNALSAQTVYEISQIPNATCSKCGRVAMPFEGFF